MDNDIQMPKNFQETLTAPIPSSVEVMTTKKSWLAVDTTKTYSWGWLPALSLISAFGLLLIAVANTLSRSTGGFYEPLFWAGLLMIILPIAARLASRQPSRRERISLVILLGLGFYLVKVIHSPYGFTFADELVHLYNVTRILETGTLFNANSILAVTPFYPGLETVTAAIASLSGLSTFSAALVVVGIARLIAMLTLFLFFEKVSGSFRLAGIAALLYATNANFLFWSAQFSYESLALPLALLVLYVAARRAATPAGVQHRGLTLIALLCILAVVITHHLTSYFLVLFLGVWTLGQLLLYFWRARTTSATDASKSSTKPLAIKNRQNSSTFTGARAISEPAGMFLFTLVVTLVWLAGVASNTPSYLSLPLSHAASSILQIISGEASTRELFQSSSGYTAPLWERIVGIGSVILMLLALPFGLRKIWQYFRSNPIAMILTGAALVYFAVLGLRLSPAAWETSNRASEFLYIGLAFVLALAVLELWGHERKPWPGRAVVLGSLAVILIGGVIAGWVPTLRLGKLLQVKAGDVVIEPQGFAAAHWIRATLGPGNQVATDESNARLMLTYGNQSTLAGRYPDIKDLLGMAEFPDWQVELMREWDIQYVAVDRRLISADIMLGYYFDRTSTGLLPSTDMYAPEVYGKFDKQRAISRLFDSGNIVIYDVEAISGCRGFMRCDKNLMISSR